MTSRREADGHPSTPTREELELHLDDPGVQAWFEAHLTELRESIASHRVLRQILVAGFVIGLVAHVGGYLLRSSVSGEPIGLAADLLYAFGFALWTGAVVAVFVQVIPEAKERQFKQALQVYEAARRRRRESQARGGQP